MPNRKKRFVVTGATGAIGKAIARQLAAKGHEVTLACRDAAKAADTAEEIVAATGNGDVHWEVVDVSRKSSIQAFAADWKGPLDVLINNAAACPRKRQETPDKIEVQFATNVLGYFWAIDGFKNALAKAASPRIVNVASYWAGGLDLDDLQFRRRPYDNDAAYRQSKQADRMLSAGFAERLAPLGIAVNACHPGDVNSKLSNDLGFGGQDSPDEGADTPVWLATDPIGGEQTGQYFERRRKSECHFSQDRAAVAALLERCAQY